MAEGALEIKGVEDGLLVSCPDYFDISLAENLHIQLSQLLDEKGKVLIFDGAQVEATDTAILQLMFAFTRDARARGIEVQWKNPSEAIHNAARFLGIKNELGLVSI